MGPYFLGKAPYWVLVRSVFSLELGLNFWPNGSFSIISSTEIGANSGLSLQQPWVKSKFGRSRRGGVIIREQLY